MKNTNPPFNAEITCPQCNATHIVAVNTKAEKQSLSDLLLGLVSGKCPICHQAINEPSIRIV